MRGGVRVFAAAASVFLGAAAARPADVLNVAVVKYIRPSPHEPILAPTLKALRDRFGDSRVHVTELTMQDLEAASTSSTGPATLPHSQAAPTPIPTTAKAPPSSSVPKATSPPGPIFSAAALPLRPRRGLRRCASKAKSPAAATTPTDFFPSGSTRARPTPR